jgi:hypothetical protein
MISSMALVHRTAAALAASILRPSGRRRDALEVRVAPSGARPPARPVPAVTRA